MRHTTFLLLTAVLIASHLDAAPCTTAPANIVANCGFETGSFSNWTLSGHDSLPGYNGIDYGVDAADAHSGTFGAYLGGIGGVVDLSQTLATNTGTNYSISFWLAQSPAPIAPYLNSFSFNFGSLSLTSLTQVPNLPFTQYSFTAAASSSLTSLAFGFQDDIGFFSIDDISVTQAAVPEPAVMSLLIFAALLFRASKAKFKLTS